MKVTIVSFGHADSVLPLFKHLKLKQLNIKLIFCFALDRMSESVLDFSDKAIHTGFLAEQENADILPLEIKKYLGNNYSQVKFFFYYNQKLLSLKNLSLSLKLAQELRNDDIIHFNGINGVLPQLLFFLRKKKLVFTIHDLRSHTGERTKHNFLEIMNNYIINCKHKVIMQNRNEYQYLINRYPTDTDKFNFIPFGILDIYREFNGGSHSSISSDLLFFGRISQYKGIEYLIDAIKYLGKQGREIKTIIAGSGHIYFTAKDLMALNIKIINKHISNSELVTLIKGTKVIICPYTDATQSGVIMTAFAFNKPVIATNVGGFRDVIENGHNGILIPPKDSKSLADTISILLFDEIIFNNLSLNIAHFENHKSDFAWDNIANKLIELYSN